MTEETTNKIVSAYLSQADDQDIRDFVTKGYFTHFSDAMRTIIREGIKAVKKERGLT